MSAAILTNADIALIMEMQQENAGAPGFWDAVSEVFGRPKKSIHKAIWNAKKTGMYKREA
jgi:hypothetical protein